MTYDDVLIIGSGVAALQLAVCLNTDKNVRIITKSELKASNSYLAQGGIAAAIDTSDHPSKHVFDTLAAGRFHNDKESVVQVLNEAPVIIREISEQGNIFDMDKDGKFLLGMEGAHQKKRILHSGGDATGKKLIEFLTSRLKENVKVEERVFVFELILNQKKGRCIGVKAKKNDGTIQVYYANHVIIATGGCGHLYRYTSNARTATGDGIAMAFLAGAEIADMEFIQFHPTLLYKNGETKGLISEAVRGEGAILVTEDGMPIMDRVHPYKDLAPRHIVSQTIFNYVQSGHNVFLDIRKIDQFEKRFPSITSICLENSIQLSEGRIPVVPGSHFLMGGIKTDLLGRTSLNGLYAIGEAACTGLHGANRLASNSLLEGLYQGKKLSEWLNSTSVNTPFLEMSNSSHLLQEKKIALPDIQILREMMMKRVGIIRSEKQLKEQRTWLNQFQIGEITELDYYSVRDITTIFMCIIARFITESAISRTESRGGHFRCDYPHEDDVKWYKKTIIHKRKEEVENFDERPETTLIT